VREYHGKTQSHLQIIYRHEIENARALAKLETDESNVCLERERCFSSTKRLLGGVVEIFEESGDESDADGENGGTLKCVYIFSKKKARRKKKKKKTGGIISSSSFTMSKCVLKK